MVVYITKYALTRGIFAVEVEDCGDGMVKTKDKYKSYYHKGQWFKTKEEAINKACQMRNKKIDALSKQLTKLQNTVFGGGL